MSAIALVADSTGHATYTDTRDHLIALGHTVTGFTHDRLAFPSDFDPYDLIVTVRLGVTNYVADGNALRALMAAGKPMLLGLLATGGTAEAVQTHPYTQAGFLGDIEYQGPADGALVIENNTHPITDGYTLGQIIPFVNSTTFHSFLDELGVGEFAGTQLANISTAGRGGLFAIDYGEQTLDLATTAAGRVVISDHIYGGGGYNAAAELLTSNIIEWLLAPPPLASEPIKGQRWPRSAGAVETPSRQEATHTTASLLDDATEAAALEMAASYRLLQIETDVPARVRVYASTSYRTADASRPIGVDPTGDHGLLLEFVTTPTLLSAFLTPIVDGSTQIGNASVPIAITNLSGGTTPVTVTLTYIGTE